MSACLNFDSRRPVMVSSHGAVACGQVQAADAAIGRLAFVTSIAFKVV